MFSLRVQFFLKMFTKVCKMSIYFIPGKWIVSYATAVQHRTPACKYRLVISNACCGVRGSIYFTYIACWLSTIRPIDSHDEKYSSLWSKSRSRFNDYRKRLLRYIFHHYTFIRPTFAICRDILPWNVLPYNTSYWCDNNITDEQYVFK